MFAVLGRGMSFSADMTSQTRWKSVVGYRFHPTDEELVGHFLMRKLLGYNDPMPEFKVCDYEPWELPDLLKKKKNDQAWYFFSPRDFKYSSSLRFNRRTRAGFWKSTGKPRKVIDKRTKKVIGTKGFLVFYKNEDPKPINTGFIMHEYDVISKGKFLLYKLKAKLEEADHKASPPDFESPSLSPMTMNSSGDEDEGFDAGSQSDENEAIIDSVHGESETDYDLGSDFDNQTLHEMNDLLITHMTSDFKNQNSDTQNNITVSALDFGNQILHEKTDTSTPIKASWSEIIEAEASLLEVNGPVTFFDQLKALGEPEECSINPALLYEDCLSYYYNSFSTSVVAGG